MVLSFNENQNGTTEEISGGCNKRYSTHQSRAMGGTSDSRSESGTVQVFPSGEDSVRRDTIRGYDYDGGTSIGKILQRLELVERSHIEYVRAHQARLEARLDESKNLEELFQESVAELRQEIYKLATETEEINGNGHKS